MAMLEQQERRSPPLETARTASDEPQLPGLGRIAWESTETMATDDMAGAGGGAGEEERGGPEGSPWVDLLSVAGGLKPCNSQNFASPHFQRKPRSHVPRSAPSHRWGFKLGPVLPSAATKKKARKKRTAKKRDRPCAICGATETPLWRTWPTDRRVMLCNACGIRVREPRAVLPELVYLTPPATATTTVVSELERSVAPPQEIQPISDSTRAALPKQVHVDLPPPVTATTTVVSAPQEIQASESSPDSPILDSMLDIDVYLLKRTSPRREKSPPPPPPPVTAEPAPAVAAPAPSNEKDMPDKWCLHCGTTSTLQWRTGPAGKSTLCNACGVRYRQGRLVLEYRPKASPTFNQSEHSNKHEEVLKIRKKQDHPAPPAVYQRIRTRRKRRKGKGQQQPAQVRKKKGNNAQNQPAQAQPAAVAAVQVRKKISKSKVQRLPPEPALLKLRKQLKGKKQDRQPPQPAANQPRAGNDMLQNPPPPPPPPALPHAGYDMVRYDLPLPPALPHAGEGMEMEQRLLFLPPVLTHADDEMEQNLPPPPPELRHAADGMDPNPMAQHLPPPPAQPHAGGELMMDEPLTPPDPFLFDGPAAPMIIDDDEPVVIVIDDD